MLQDLTRFVSSKTIERDQIKPCGNSIEHSSRPFIRPRLVPRSWKVYRLTLRLSDEGFHRGAQTRLKPGQIQGLSLLPFGPFIAEVQ
jgi:hypothetical protein